MRREVRLPRCLPETLAGLLLTIRRKIVDLLSLWLAAFTVRVGVLPPSTAVAAPTLTEVQLGFRHLFLLPMIACYLPAPGRFNAAVGRAGHPSDG